MGLLHQEDNVTDNVPGETIMLEDVCVSYSECIVYFTIAPILYLTVSVFICVGNILTIVAVVKTPKLQTLPNMHIVSLACADIISGVYVFNLAFLHIGSTHETVGHIKPFCLSLYVLFVIGSLASSASIVLIAVDRYIYIVHPYRYPDLITLSKTRVIIAGAWLGAVIVSAGVIKFNNYDSVGECSFVHVLDYAYQLVSQSVIFFVTVSIVGVLYARIIIIATRQRRAINSAQMRTDQGWRHIMKMIRLLTLICGIYIACWMPAHVLICFSIITQQFPSSLTFLFLLGTLNSGVNFIIYPLMNRDFRDAMKRLVRFRNQNEVKPLTTRVSVLPSQMSTL